MLRLGEPVAVVGLGKLGLSWACVLAAKGQPVRGVDCDEGVVEALNCGEYRGPEPRVAELLKEHKQHLQAATSFDAIAGTSAAFVVVNTPNVNGKFSLEYVLPAVQEIAKHVAAAGKPHYTIVLMSTVMPGDCEREIWPAIEEASGERRGQGLELFHCPEFVALGKVVQNMLQPEYVVIGSPSESAAKSVEEYYRGIVDNRPAYHTMSLVNAEITKLALNVAVSFKITCANLLAQICQRIPGADVDEVTKAVGGDSRIGGRFFRGGLGYAGPCFPRDIQSLRTLCAELNLDTAIPDSIDRFNCSIPARLLEVVLRSPPENTAVAVLGLGYRAGTGIDKDSQAVALVRCLLAAHVPVAVYDPEITQQTSTLGKPRGLIWCKTLDECLSFADKVVIATEDERFKALSPRQCQGKTLIDCWRHIPAERFDRADVSYVALGRGAETIEKRSGQRQHESRGN